MIFGAFLPLVFVLVLGLLLAAIVIVREIRTIISASAGTGSKKPPVSLVRESLSQELSARNKQLKQDEPRKQPLESKNEVNSAGGAVWRW
jgi:hypothetical protein